MQSLYHSISPVVIPLFGEQWMMARQAAMLGAGRDVTVPFPIKASVLAPKLRSALNQVGSRCIVFRVDSKGQRLEL